MSVIIFSYSGQMQLQYLHEATTTSFQIPSNLSFTNHGRQNEQWDMLNAPSSDPHNINTSSLLSTRYTACNTSVNVFSSFRFILFFISSYSLPLRNLMVLLFIIQLINSCIHPLLFPFAILPFRHSSSSYILLILMCVILWFIHFF